jgi:Holliday junction resolvasome RuvABC endonuclease subunit
LTRVLGLDVSSLSTGWTIIVEGENAVELQDYGLITNDERDCLGLKLDNFAQELHKVLVKYPDIQWVGIEDTYEQNVVTMKTLSKFAGVAIRQIYQVLGIGATYSEDLLTKALHMKRKAPPERGIYLPMPLTVTRLIGIKGSMHRDEKKQKVVDWVNLYFHKRFTFDQNDITDSIAVACSTIFKIKNIQF